MIVKLTSMAERIGELAHITILQKKKSIRSKGCITISAQLKWLYLVCPSMHVSMIVLNDQEFAKLGNRLSIKGECEKLERYYYT